MTDIITGSGFTSTYVRQFEEVIHLIATQKASHALRIFPTTVVMGKSDVIRRLGLAESQLLTGDFSSRVDLKKINTDFRYLIMQIFTVGPFGVSPKDIEKMKIDPTNDISERIGSAIGITADQIVLNALVGTALSGETGSTSVNANANIAINDHSFDDLEDSLSGNIGLTVGKLINARMQIMAYRKALGLMDERLVVFASMKQLSNLTREKRFTNYFYNNAKPLVDGLYSQFLNMEFIATEFIPADANGNDQVIVVDPRGLKIGLSPAAIKTAIYPDYSAVTIDSIMVRGEIEIGAVRLEEGLVQGISCL